MSFEVIDRKTFTEVLYPKDIYDITDYFVRECVKRELPMRVCKNCERYFVLSRRASAKYYDGHIDDKGHICKGLGAIYAWNEKREGDDVFKVYRQECKTRFSIIKAGQIVQDNFYTWSERAEDDKTKYDAGTIY